MILLNVVDANSQVIEAVLDEELFYIVLDWNSTNKSWSLGLRNSTYDLVITGIAVVVNYPITYQFRYRTMPRGELFVAHYKDRDGPVPRNGFIPEPGFAADYELVYVTEEEMKAEWYQGDWNTRVI